MKLFLHHKEGYITVSKSSHWCPPNIREVYGTSRGFLFKDYKCAGGVYKRFKKTVKVLWYTYEEI